MKSGIEKWHELDGDNTLALDWPLNEDSHVWEIGGFEGRWAQQIWDKFHCNITIFEPQLWAAQKMINRFNGNKKISIRPYGLWTQYGSFPLGDFFTDGASLLKDKFPVGYTSHFQNYSAVLENPIHPIDLALMNIEGAEYTLIPEFIKSGVINKLKNFWCQFHPADENDDRHIGIFLGMSKTHDMLWNCYPTAVAWKRRD